jgi:hypothetical protein
MPNHLHLLIEMGKIPVSKVLQRLHTTYTLYFNKKYNRVGHVFQGRYKAILCDKDAYLLELIRYIHLNPVRAGLVVDAQDYPWSSHRIYLGLDPSKSVNSSFVLKQFSTDPLGAKEAYRSFVIGGIAQGRRHDFYKVTDQRILGDEDFLQEITQYVGAQEEELPETPARFFELDELRTALETVTGSRFGFRRSREKVDTWMRRIFCYMTRTYGWYKAKDVARYLGRDLATVTQGVRFVEGLIRNGDPRTVEVVNKVLDAMGTNRISRK